MPTGRARVGDVAHQDVLDRMATGQAGHDPTRRIGPPVRTTNIDSTSAPAAPLLSGRAGTAYPVGVMVGVLKDIHVRRSTSRRCAYSGALMMPTARNGAVKLIDGATKPASLTIEQQWWLLSCSC